MERAIEASTTIAAAPARVREVLLDDPGSVVCESPTAEQRRSREFPVDMAVDLGQCSGVHKGVLLRLGAPRSSGPEALVVPISWQARGHQELFPTFVGELALLEDRTGTRLQLTGTYRVPLGVIGGFGDGLAGRRLARRSIAALVEQVARRLDEEVARRVHTIAGAAAARPVTVREDHHSEIYVA